MRNEDLNELKTNYAFVGMKVVILKDDDNATRNEEDLPATGRDGSGGQ